MKTYYELLGLEPTADAEAIKKAFRREIARYHPDKVIHLGPEFQEMAATRAAELTAAYKTLTDQGLRAEYDAALAVGAPAVAPPPQAPSAPQAAPPPPPDSAEQPPQPEPAGGAPAGGRRFEAERAGRDVILRRAAAARVQETMQRIYGEVRTPSVKGFDLALVPAARPRLLGTPPPRVLVRIAEAADASLVNECWPAAARARVHEGKSPVFVLLLSSRIAPAAELAKAVEALQRQPAAAGAPASMALAIVDLNDWSARLPPSAPKALRALAEALRR